jgi:drug/metabolite transporter (DMT)-like permease
MDETNPFTILGVLLILLGVVFVSLPYISKLVDVDKIP